MTNQICFLSFPRAVWIRERERDRERKKEREKERDGFWWSLFILPKKWEICEMNFAFFGVDKVSLCPLFRVRNDSQLGFWPLFLSWQSCTEKKFCFTLTHTQTGTYYCTRIVTPSAPLFMFYAPIYWGSGKKVCNKASSLGKKRESK